MTKKVLYICHNHPSVRPGGAELYAWELYQAMHSSSEFEPIFLARVGSPTPHPGTPFGTIDGDSNQYLFYTDSSDFDSFYGTVRNKEILTKSFHEFLLAHQPDVVHLQHTFFLGYDIIRQIKNTLPNTPIVYTLHEFLPICFHHGQMIRTQNYERCNTSSPRRCNECFPHISPQTFFMRKHYIQSHLSLVDLFLTPSRFLLERYREWGIPPEKIRYEPNGRRLAPRIQDSDSTRRRNRLGYFGQLSPYKGVDILLNAMKLLGEQDSELSDLFDSRFRRGAERIADDLNQRERDVHLWIHGANVEIQSGTFQNAFHALLEETKHNTTMVGRYEPAELPRLMANVDWVVMPSIWWENAPLVIQEAFQYGRPVICSDIGGMAEHVSHGVNGLHFRVGDPVSLAHAIRQAVNTPGLWQKLRAGIPRVYQLEEQVAALSDLYLTLLQRTA